MAATIPPESGASDRAPSRWLAALIASVWLTMFLALAYALVGWVSVRVRGAVAAEATMVVGGVCWFSAVTSLAVASLFRGQLAPAGVLLGMFFRMALPLAAGGMIQATNPRLVEAGAIEILVVCYLVALTAETVLLVRLVGKDSGKPKA